MGKRFKDMNKEEKRKYHNERVREWRRNNREKDLAHKKKWRDENKEKKSLSDAKYYQEHNEEILRRLRNYQKENPEKFKQKREYINNYMKKYNKNPESRKLYLARQNDYKLRKGLIKIYKKCVFCDSKENLEMHHVDYHNQDIIILCRKCHRKLHRKYKFKQEDKQNGRSRKT